MQRYGLIVMNKATFALRAGIFFLVIYIMPHFAFADDKNCQHWLTRSDVEPIWNSDQIVNAALYHSRQFLESNDFTVRRNLKAIKAMLSGGRDAFAFDLNRLGPEAHLIDGGAGEVVALQEYLESGPIEGLADATAITFRASDGIPSFSGHLHVIKGRLLEEIPNAEIGLADLIFDVYGAIIYSAAPDFVLQKYASLLKPNGAIYLVAGVSFDGKSLTPDNAIYIQNAEDKVQYLHQWIRDHVKGFGVEILKSQYTEGNLTGTVYAVRLTKNGDPIEIPRLELVNVDASQPPYLSRWFAPVTKSPPHSVIAPEASPLLSETVKRTRAPPVPEVELEDSTRELNAVLMAMQVISAPKDKINKGAELLVKASNFSDVNKLREVLNVLFTATKARSNDRATWWDGEYRLTSWLIQNLKKRLRLAEAETFVRAASFLADRGFLAKHLLSLVSDFSDMDSITNILRDLDPETNASRSDQDDYSREHAFLQTLLERLPPVASQDFVELVQSIRYYENRSLVARVARVRVPARWSEEKDVSFLKSVFLALSDPNDKGGSYRRELSFVERLAPHLASPTALRTVISYLQNPGSAQNLAVLAAPSLEDLSDIDSLAGIFDLIPPSAAEAYKRALASNPKLTLSPEQIYLRAKSYRPPQPRPRSQGQSSIGFMMI